LRHPLQRSVEPTPTFLCILARHDAGDGGIDGIIKEDRLGLAVIHAQAKRWQRSVGRPDVQRFAGRLDGVRPEGHTYNNIG
jgi:restriction endonuclease Mrr